MKSFERTNRMKASKLFLLGSLILLINFELFSQKDNEFWFAAPAVTKDHSAETGTNCLGTTKMGAAPVSLNFTNTNDADAIVTIEQPANEYDASTNPNGFSPIIITVPANSFYRYELWGNDLCIAANQAMRKNVETRIDPTVPTTVLKSGLHITSTEYITAYYEVEEANNSDIFALKGSNALGDEFFVPFQTNKENVSFTNQPAYSSINIVAVDAGTTTITVYPTNEVIGWGSAPFSFTLQQGQSISLVPGKDNGGGSYTINRAPADRLAGTRIVVSGNKRVAVTTGDDSVRGDSGCYDLIGDQLIPVEALYTDGSREALVGTEYVVMQGDLGTGNNDRLYIVATEDNTDVTITDVDGGGSVTINNMMSQDQETYVIATAEPTTYIESTKPVYVFHVTGAGGGCEIGGSILPSVSGCTGSYDVGFSRGDDGNKDFLLNIMIREENDNDSARYAFTFNGTARPDLGDDFEKVPGTKWWVGQFDFDSEVSEYTKNILSNSKSIFHLGTLNGGSSNGGNYGYFSDYSSVSGRSYVSGVGQAGIKMCYGETVQLIAEGGLTYEWLEYDATSGSYSLGRFLSDNYAQKPYATPFSSIKYSVVVMGACNLSDTVGIELLVADSLSAEFETDVAFGCAPLTVNINNTSYNSQKDYWYIDGVFNTFDSQPDTFVFNNVSDTARDYTIRLVTRNSYCSKAYEKDIRVFPEIHAGFFISDTVGCSPFNVQFNDTASGNIDTISTSGYLWDFGDLSSSNEREPLHTFTNITTSSQILNIQQVVTSPFLCRDTANQEITLLPYIEAAFTASPSVSCSPLEIELDPQNSIGVDTFFWHIYDSKYVSDSVYTATNENIIPFYHSDNTQIAPDSIYIGLITRNDEGCYDTVQEKLFVVYPEVHSLFTPSTDTICDSLQITFDNQSVGYNLQYYWDFDDGNSLSDNTGNDIDHIFYNRGDIDSTYYVSLIAHSNYFCYDTMDVPIVVHPFVNAHFTVEHQNNCAPLQTNIYNSSINPPGSTFYWDTGDGYSFNLGVKSDFSHEFTNTSDNTDSTYTINLRVVTPQGCESLFDKDVLVYPEVVPSFTLNIDEGCQPLLVNFTNQSQGGTLTYDWDFGDQSSKTDLSKINFQKTFENASSNDTTYYINLLAMNAHGCSNSFIDSVLVYAFIEADYDLANPDSCSPFPLDISNTSRGGIADYNWEFDDGSAQSNLYEPSHTYTNTTDNIINRNLRLVVKNTHACYDTLIKEVKVYPEIVADFTTSDGVYENCQPFDVQFVNNSNIPATNFKWDFGDAGGSVLGAPDHLFTNSGTIDSTYTVTLTATSDYGCRDVISKDIISYAFIESSFAVENTDSCSPFPLRINNLSPGGVDEFFWNFGDGSSVSNLKTPTHTYSNKTNSVIYPTLELIVKNQHACYDTMQQQITVFPEVIANFRTGDGLYEACQPFAVDFVNTSNVPAKYFIWTMDDGTYSIEENPSQMFENYSSTDQTYHVNLYAESEYQCIDDTTIDIMAYAYTEAAFSVDDNDVCYSYPIEITNESSPGSVQFDWDLGNGETRNDANGFTYTWLDETEGRTYNLSLTARNSHGCSHNLTMPIEIFPQVRAKIAFSDSTNCHPVFTKLFNLSENVDSNDKFYWDFGNNSGTSSSFQPNDREFTNEGLTDKIYDVILKAEERDNGCYGYDTLPITVHAVPITSFELVGGLTKGCPYFPVDILNTTSPVQDYANTYQFIFGDKTSPVITINKDNVTHDYDNLTSVNQNYNLTLITSSAMGCKDTAFQTITVHPRVTAGFQAMGATEACSPYILEFEDRSVNEDVYEWSFGDGNISSDEFPSNRYVNDSDSIRTYKVLLKAISDYQCWDTTSTVVTIYPQPTALFYASPHSQYYPNATVEIDNRTNHETIWNYDWDFDDNTTHQTSYEPDPHTYGYWGEYKIKLNVWSDYCADSMSRIITVYPALPIAQFDTSVQGCVPFTVTFLDNSIYGTTHSWDFDDGNTYISGPGNNHEEQLSEWGEEVTHTFTKAGLYNVVLTIEGDGGTDQTNNIIEVYPLPEVSFDIAPKTVMLPDEKIQTFNSTVAKEGYQWLWNFGDGGYSSSKEPDHLYTELGLYDISLTVWTEHMCVDSLILEQIVSVEGAGVMEFPNAFVPSLSGPSNGSYSINSPTTSVFHPYHDGVVDYRLEIYTRWGELIFVSDDVNIGWDGYIKGTLAKQDVYVWRVKGTYTNGNPFVKAGDVTLLISPNQVE